MNPAFLLHKRVNLKVLSERVHTQAWKNANTRKDRNLTLYLSLSSLRWSIHSHLLSYFLTLLKSWVIWETFISLRISSSLFFMYFVKILPASLHLRSVFLSLELNGIISLDYRFYSSFLNINLRPSRRQ